MVQAVSSIKQSLCGGETLGKVDLFCTLALVHFLAKLKGGAGVLWLEHTPKAALSLATPPSSHYSPTHRQLQCKLYCVTFSLQPWKGSTGPFRASAAGSIDSTAWAGTERARGGQHSMGNLPAANVAEFNPL